MNNITLYIRSLIIADISGSITPDEKAHLELLIKEVPEVKALSEYLHKVLNRDKLQDEAIQKIKDLVTSRRTVSKMRRRYITTIAAAACLLGIISLFLFQGRKKDKPEISLAEGCPVMLTTDKDALVLNGRAINIDENGIFLYNNKKYQLSRGRIHVPAGRGYSVNLSDGSSILLNAQSRLTLPAGFKEGKLEFSLAGEAYMNIVKNAGRSVTVHLPNSKVTVLGTKFNVKGDEKESITSLVSGSVEVTGRRKTITLKPNHRAICTDNEIEMEEFDAGKAIAWTEPVSTLSNPSGPDIERTFLKCYGIKLSISKSGRRNYLTLAMDRRESPEEFLQRCKDMYPDLEYYYQDGAYYLK